MILEAPKSVLSPQHHGRGNKFRVVGGCSPTPWEWGGVGEREILGASRMGKAVGWGWSLKWANWVHVTNFVSRLLDLGFGVPY